MRQQYSELVAEIVEKKKKLAEARTMKVQAQSALQKAAEFVRFGEVSLAESEQALNSMEDVIFGSESKS